MAWWVVVGHAIHLAGVPVWIPQAASDFLTKGGVAVNVFIMISGFVITHLLVNKSEGYVAYITRRFFRIFPIYILCIVVSVAFVGMYEAVYAEPSWVFEKEMRGDRLLHQDENFFWHSIAHLTMLHGAIPESILKYASTTFLAPAWSLSLEWQFYLVAPLILFFMKRSLTCASFVCAALLVLGFASKALFATAYPFPSMLFLSIQFFLIGIISRLLFPTVAVLKEKVWPVAIPIIASMLFLRSIEGIIWTVFMVFCVVELDGVRMPRWLQRLQFVFGVNRVVRYFGACSYSTYLAHIPVFVLVVSLVGRFQDVGNQTVFQIAVLFAMLVTAVVSPLLYHWVEKPFIAVGKRIAINREAGRNG